MEKFINLNNQHPENIADIPPTMEAALEKNPDLVDQVFGNDKLRAPDEFIYGNSRIKEEGFAGLFGEMAGFDGSEESDQVAANTLAFVDLTARLHGREFDGIGGFDELFIDGEPISKEDLNKIITPYLEQNPAVGQLVNKYVNQVDPEEVNPEATKRLLATGFYLVDETLDMQAEAEVQAGFDERFDDIVSAETQQVELDQRFEEIVSEDLFDVRSQEDFDREFAQKMHETYVAPTEDYDAEFTEITQRVLGDLDSRTPEQYDEAIREIEENFTVIGEKKDKDTLSYVRWMSEISQNGIRVHRSMVLRGIERGEEVMNQGVQTSKKMARATRATLDLLTGKYLTRSDGEDDL